MEKNNISDIELLESLIPEHHSRDFLVKLINTLPNIVAILDDDRRLVFSNRTMEMILGENNLNASFNLRPGEIFRCINANKTPGGCGTSKACEYCGAMSAMKRSRAEGKTFSSNYRIFSSVNGKNKAYNFRFTSTPLQTADNFFYVVTLEDISDHSRREELERIFYHDLLNSLGSLHGVISLIKEKEQTEPLYIDILETTYNTLFDTISEQKQYALAESGQLAVRNEEIHTRDLLIETALPFSGDFHRGPVVEVEEEITEMVFVSDPSLLGRVLINMIKNAVEASDKEHPVRIGVTRSGTQLRFWVQNQGVIPREIQQQIFKRSFTTKGKGRGLGTFSMKLIGESYLGGIVDFSSNEKSGTVFTIDLPIHP